MRSVTELTDAIAALRLMFFVSKPSSTHEEETRSGALGNPSQTTFATRPLRSNVGKHQRTVCTRLCGKGRLAISLEGVSRAACFFQVAFQPSLVLRSPHLHRRHCSQDLRHTYSEESLRNPRESSRWQVPKIKARTLSFQMTWHVRMPQ